MRKSLLWIALAGVAAASVAMARRPTSPPAWPWPGPDATRVDPAHFHLLLDNNYTRVLGFEAKRGTKVSRNYQPDTVVYPSAEGCKVRFVYSPDQSRDVPFPAGGAVWVGSEAHEIEVIGSEACRLTLVQLKPPICL